MLPDAVEMLKDAVEMLPRCCRDAEMLPRCCRDAVEMLSGCCLDAVEIAVRRKQFTAVEMLKDAARCH